jgi:hypothetical protein
MSTVGIVDLAEEIISWHHEQRRRTGELLRPGLSKPELEAFQEVLCASLPEEFRELYAWRDGMMRGPLAEVEIFPGLQLLSSQQILEHRENALNYFDRWSPTWVPSLWDGSNGHYVIDCGRLDASGRSAPVFSWTPASGSADPLEWYTSLTQMFRVMATCFEEGLPPRRALPGAAHNDEVAVAGWVHALRTTKSTTFLVLQDASGSVQAVAAPDRIEHLQREDAVRLRGRVRAAAQPGGFGLDVLELQVVGAASGPLPIETHRDPEERGLGPELLIDCRPLALRTARYATIFRLQAALIEAFRAALRRRRFTEIVSSKIVADGTEGGANLFALQYFDRVAYLAQSPQFYKEHGVLGFERVFETGHVYHAEPHASSRHLTEYYSLDLELGFIDGPRICSSSSAKCSARCSSSCRASSAGIA